MNTVKVREVMNREYVGVSESDDLLETVELLLREHAAAAIVLRGSEPVGVVTERDVLALLVDGPDPEEATVADAMTASIPTVAPDESIESATDQMSTQSAGRLVVTNGSEPLGIVTERDLLASRRYQTESEEMVAAEAGVTAASATDTRTESEDQFEDQGICEVCGALTRDLSSFNGQLLCGDCRDM